MTSLQEHLDDVTVLVPQGDQGLQGPPGPFEYVDPPEDLYIKGEQVSSTAVLFWFLCGSTAVLLWSHCICCVLSQGPPGLKGVCGSQGLSVCWTSGVKGLHVLKGSGFSVTCWLSLVSGSTSWAWNERGEGYCGISWAQGELVSITSRFFSSSTTS